MGGLKNNYENGLGKNMEGFKVSMITSTKVVARRVDTMKKKILSIILVMALCVTFAPNVAASTTVSGTSVSVSTLTAAITANGDLYCWGRNTSGQLGIGNSGASGSTPIKVLSNVASVTTDNINVAAITTNGDLYCWGGNEFGQVGNGKSGMYERQESPVKVLSKVVSVTMENGTITAITTNGDLYSWGRNVYGQVGNGKGGAGVCQSTPVKVMSNVVSIMMDEYRTSKVTTLAITTNGDLYAWGYNEHGQVGNGKSGTGAYETTPVKVLSNVVSLTANDGPAAAITTNGDLYCWGINLFGQVGNGSSRDNQTTPVKVLTNVVSVTTSQTTVAITENGDLYAWGYNEIGQVGNGMEAYSQDSQTTPVKVLSNVVSVTSSVTNTAAITTNGDLYCWGENGAGQIGNGETKIQTAPVKVLSNVASFTTDNGNTSAAITTNGDLYCWGSTAEGQVGNGNSNGEETGTLVDQKQTTPVKVLSNVISVIMDGYLTASVTKNGELYCWGINGDSQVGNGSTTNQTTPFKALTGIRVPNAAPSLPAITATPTASKVLVDGENFSFDAYNIAGNNYFKLRDLAYIMNGSVKQFSVSWDGVNNAISLQSGQAYITVGGEMAKKGTAAATPIPTTSKIILDGKIVSLTAYNIAGNNYFKLRDVGSAFDFNVSWNGSLQTIEIDSTSSYTLD